MLKNIRIVLLEPSHPGNIGSAARAMKTMGLNKLFLVNPKLFPDPKATELAAGAADLVEAAIVVDTMVEAIADCGLVLGTSARERTIQMPLLNPHECAKEVTEISTREKVAIVFGRERVGMYNDELLACQNHVYIPSNPEYSSLNLAMAVQVICYEIRMAHQNESHTIDNEMGPLATAEDLDCFYQHLETVLLTTGFLNPKAPKKLMPRLKRLFGRIRLEEMEVNILRGILSSVEKALSRLNS